MRACARFARAGIGEERKVSQLNRRQALRLFGAVGMAGAAAPLLSACTTSNDISDQEKSSENIAPAGGPSV